LTRVAEYRYSLLAEADADDIAAFTVRTWDARQAYQYLVGLEALCQSLADRQAFGARACTDIAPGLFRIGYVSHVVFFRQTLYGIRVLRILHERQLPELHSFEDEEDEE
jgi:toxin ParE1/3/4